MIRTQRISHPALICRDIEETLRFYTEVLGMELVLRQPNLDDPSSTHIFLHAGANTFIAFFGPAEASTARLAHGTLGVGSLQHLAFDVDAETFQRAQEHLRARGIFFHGPIDRGYERSLYFRDPNGIILELLTWITPLPEEAKMAEVLKQAQRLREAEGADHIKDAHIRRVLSRRD